MKKIAFLLLIGSLMAGCTSIRTSDTGEKSARTSEAYYDYFLTPYNDQAAYKQ